MTKIEELRNDIKQRFDRLRVEQEKIVAIREKAKTERVEAERQSLELDKRLSELLADIYLGKTPKFQGTKGLIRVKKEKARLREIVEQYPLLDEGLRREEARIPRRGSKIVADENKLREYEKIRSELVTNPHRQRDLLEAKLRSLAGDPALDCREETELFLKGEVRGGQMSGN